MGQKKKIESDGRFSRRKETDSKDGTCGFRLVLAVGLCYNLLMNMKNITEKYIGCHLSAAKGFEAMGKDAVSIGANTFAFFTRNPRGGKAKEIDPADAERLRSLMEEHHFGKLVAHAPYTMNVCAAKPDIREYSWNILKYDMERM